MAEAPRTLYFGSGPFALPALECLLGSPLVDLVAVVTAPPRPAGRRGVLTPTPVATLAGARGIAPMTPSSLRDAATLEIVRALDPDLVVLADYGRLVPAAVLELPRFGALNLHPSLLPRHRGAAPVAAAILAGDAVTGVTLMRMEEGLDTGPILTQREVRLDGTETAPALEDRLATVAADLLMESLPAWLAGSLRAQPQPEAGATTTRPLRRSDAWLDPQRPAEELERQVRAYQPWPGAAVEHAGGHLKVWAASVVDGGADAEPGAIVPLDDGLALATVGGLLRLDEVQPPGGRRMSGAAYCHGRRL